MQRVDELTRRENDPYKRIKESIKAKKKNPEKVHMQAMERYLRDVESRAKEDKLLAVQQRPLNEEVVKKHFFGNINPKMLESTCDLSIMGVPHSMFERMNHQQMIKTMVTKNTAKKVKEVIQSQIKEKKLRELKERQTKMVTLLH